MYKIVPARGLSCEEIAFIREEFEHIVGVSKFPPWMQFNLAGRGLQQLGLDSVCAVN